MKVVVQNELRMIVQTCLKSELKSYRAKQLKKVYKTHEYE